jgi:alditol oxidase
VTHRTERNWAGNLTYGAAQFVDCESVGEVQEIVAQANRVRPLGTRHSFNDIANSPDTIISVVNIDPAPVIDEQQCTLTIGAGARYAVAARFAEQHGRALHNLGSLPHISIGGAISTGTHGSGNSNGSLATAVSALEIVTASGELLTVRRGEPNFDAMVVGLGVFGIITRVSLDLQPTFNVRQDSYRLLPWDAFLADVDGAMGAAYSVSVFTDWRGDHIEQIWLKSRLDHGPDRQTSRDMSAPVPEQFRGAVRDISGVPRLGESMTGNFTVQGQPGPWLDRLPHFRRDASPSVGDELQSEHFVDRSVAADALRAVRSLASQMADVLVISELRTVAADSLWLSPAYELDVLAMHFTWKNDIAAVMAVVGQIEEALAPFAVRPHWGKVHGVTGTTLATRYPRLAEFATLAESFDPTHKFRNSAIDGLLQNS